MTEYIFVPEASLAAVATVEADDPLTALNQADLGPLPQRITAVQVIGTYWVLEEDAPDVVRKATDASRARAAAVEAEAQPAAPAAG